jgi:nitrite reductase/ring-hydroxylating ferredoxin subunit
MMRQDPPLSALLARLAEQSRRPANRAMALPPALYWRPDVWQLEVERIFEGEWMCVGRIDQIPNPGDWLAVDLVGEPLMIVRDRAGVLRALSRICRHRGMDLLHEATERTGSASHFQCPYHHWSFDLDGRLKGAPLMEGSQVFDKAACALPTFALEIWQGFVFVALDPAAGPLAPRMTPLEAVLGAIDMSDWRIAGTLPWGAVDVNWKVAFENYAEFYHHIGTHQQSLQALWPAAMVRFEAGDSDALFIGRMHVNPALATGVDDGHPVQPIGLPPVPGLTPAQRAQSVVMGVFPMFGLVFGPDGAIWFEWCPTGAESHRLDIHVVVPPQSFEAPGFDAGLAHMLDSLRGIQTEDSIANAGVQRSARARHAVGGPLAPIESTLLQFQRYLARRLCD